jgi:asparagine synthase (glutamine-hydrolysing)
MCGIAGMVGPGCRLSGLRAMVSAQHHRGPDDDGVFLAPSGCAGLGHNRLSIIDLSSAGRQPMATPDGRLHVVFNGEIYNYLELRAELAAYPFRTRTDTEVLLAAYLRWGTGCLDRMIGMFAFLLWDERERRLIAARDRFGVKPLYYHAGADGTLVLGSEIKALWAAGVPRDPDAGTWADYLVHGLGDHGPRTFWDGVARLAPGTFLEWQDGRHRLTRWYDVADRVGEELDGRPADEVREEYAALLRDSVRLRFRSDVPVGISLSGGVDSATLLGLVSAVRGADDDVQAFTFVTDDARYDELPWVERALARTRHPLTVCRLSADQVPALAESVQDAEDEPFGGIPTLAYARVFEEARARGVTVLLDGQGMDEQWGGYDYYREALRGGEPGLVQGSVSPPVQSDCVTVELSRLASPADRVRPFTDALRNAQYRDLCLTKLPRALRYNDRVSMRVSEELREPFLDHRLVELALRQPPERKIDGARGKHLLRTIAAGLMPAGLVEAPKRPVQTPQREWLRGPLREWAETEIESALESVGGTWLDAAAVRTRWRRFCLGEGDNSHFVWQWISLGLLLNTASPARAIRA